MHTRSLAFERLDGRNRNEKTMKCISKLSFTRLEFYRDDEKVFSMTFKCEGGFRPETSENYVTKQDCLNAVQRLSLLMPDTKLIEK